MGGFKFLSVVMQMSNYSKASKKVNKFWLDQFIYPGFTDLLTNKMERDCKVYVGNLPADVRENEVDDLFYKYGRIRNVTLKSKYEAAFAFVEFDDPIDAQDAVDGRDGYKFDGYKLRVEFTRGNRREGGGGDFQSRRGASRPQQQQNSYSYRHNAPASRRTEHAVSITGLPASGSWQDLKDHMRKAGDVCYADVNRDGTGVVEFLHREGMKNAIKDLDDTKFRSHEGESAYIRVRARFESPRHSHSRSRSYNTRSPLSPRRSRSPAQVREAEDSYKKRERSYSRSPVRERSPY